MENKPQAATGKFISSKTYDTKPNVIVIVEPCYTVWSRPENDKINFIVK